VNEISSYNPRIHWFAVLTALSTLALIGVGGVVTSEGVGMAVPDWPNTYGYNMFFFPVSHWVGGILWEHSHRLVASGVGFLTLVLCIWLFGRSGRGFLRFGLSPLFGLVGCWAYFRAEPRLQDAVLLFSLSIFAFVVSLVWPRCEPSRRTLRRMGVIALVGVILQGVLGGLRVTLLADQIGIIHASVAQLFFVFMCSIALLSSKAWNRVQSQVQGRGVPRWLAVAMVCLTVLIFGQLILGASMRHQHAGLAVSEFPLIAHGKVWPATDEASIDQLNRDRIDYREFNPITKNQILLHMTHRLTAFGIFTLAGLLVFGALRSLPQGHGLGNALIIWFAVICLQAVLGAATVWSNKAADIATLHVVLGAVALALGGLLSIIASRLAWAIPARSSESVEPSSHEALPNPASTSMAHSLF
jgi:heme a synthase